MFMKRFIALFLFILASSQCYADGTNDFLKAVNNRDTEKLQIAINNGHTCVNLLRSEVRDGSKEGVHYLLEMRGEENCNVSPSYLKGFLMLALKKKKYDTAEVFFHHGVNLRANQLHELPNESISWLIDYGLNLSDIRDEKGKNALDYAIKSSNLDATFFLLQNGVELTDQNSPSIQNVIENYDIAEEYNTKLGYPSNKYSEEDAIKVIELLLVQGANINQVGPKGHTPLLTSRGKITRFLLENGADPNSLCTPGGTRLMVAAYQGDIETIKLLLEYGADITIKDKYGDNAMDAAQKGMNQISSGSLKPDQLEKNLSRMVDVVVLLQNNNGGTTIDLVAEATGLGAGNLRILRAKSKAVLDKVCFFVFFYFPAVLMGLFACIGSCFKKMRHSIYGSSALMACAIAAPLSTIAMHSILNSSNGGWAIAKILPFFVVQTAIIAACIAAVTFIVILSISIFIRKKRTRL